MAVKIRLKRMGKRKQPVYRVVVSDSRKARSGDYIEAIGFYDPRQEPSRVDIENERAIDWLQKGAQPTEAARKLLEISGAWTQFKIAKGEVHTVGAKPAPADEPTPAAEPAPADEVVAEPSADEVAEDVAPEAVTPEDEAPEAVAEVDDESAEDAPVDDAPADEDE
jgi:small subunit ribosomal protein S16